MFQSAWFGVLAVLMLTKSVCTSEIQYRVGRTVVTGNTITYNGRTIHRFRGIPFAKPPVGDLRFKAPVPHYFDATESLNATQEHNDCPQIRWTGNPYDSTAPIGEDCLYGTVWVPEKVRERFVRRRLLAPVIIIFHGGGFATGSSQDLMHDGRAIAGEQDIVVVGFNYRVGAFGFMDFNTDDVPGNMGLMDQQLALKWVQRYIRYFGGDPKKVTAIGESAGAMSVGIHILNPESRALFKRAIMDSGSILAEMANNSKTRGLSMAAQLGCDTQSVQAATQCLKTANMSDISAAQETVSSGLTQFIPTIGSRFIPNCIYKSIQQIRGRIPEVLMGTTLREGSLFVMDLNTTDEASAAANIAALKEGNRLYPYGSVDAYVKQLQQGVEDFVSDGLFNCPSLKFAYELSKKSARISFYQMKYYGNLNIFGIPPHAHHIIGFVYQAGLPLFFSGQNMTLRDLAVSRQMVAMIANFARLNTFMPVMYATKPLVMYSPSRRFVNVFEENGSLTSRRFHEREQICQNVWGYLVPKAKRCEG